MPKLTSILQDYLDDYNLSSAKEVKLVFFQDAIEHVSRIARMIRQERGNALLVGVGGTGKQSLTRLASHICGYKCFQIELSRGYNYDTFHEDLRKLYKMAGVEDKDMVFLFTDTQDLRVLIKKKESRVCEGASLKMSVAVCEDMAAAAEHSDGFSSAEDETFTAVDCGANLPLGFACTIPMNPAEVVVAAQSAQKRH
ncbi:UNVERIFIED_CONTAM: hypothetical protein K2H54_031198 [Gekko kuhli]